MQINALVRNIDSLGTSDCSQSQLHQRRKENINSTENCFTRLRVNVKDPSLLKDELINKVPNSGIVKKDNDIQIVFGLQVAEVRNAVEDYLKTI